MSVVINSQSLWATTTNKRIHFMANWCLQISLNLLIRRHTKETGYAESQRVKQGWIRTEGSLFGWTTINKLPNIKNQEKNHYETINYKYFPQRPPLVIPSPSRVIVSLVLPTGMAPLAYSLSLSPWTVHAFLWLFYRLLINVSNEFSFCFLQVKHQNLIGLKNILKRKQRW